MKDAQNGTICPIISYTDIREISSLTGRDWEVYMAILTLKEQNKVLRYRFDDDRRRALVSLLLQKATVREHLGVDSNADFEICRTQEVSAYGVKVNEHRRIGLQ